MGIGDQVALPMQKLFARRKQMQEEYYTGEWDFLFSRRSALTCLLLLTAFSLYIEFFSQDVKQRESFPGYLSARSFLVPPASRAVSLPMNEAGDESQNGIPIAAAASPTSTSFKSSNPDSALPKGKLKVLLAVFNLAYNHQRRNIIRSAYTVQSSYYADFAVRFVLGGFNLPTWLDSENATHRDFIVLQCKENLNDGKTFNFFSSLPTIADVKGLKFDYVMKTDDDSYVRFENLGKHLWLLPRTDLYYGYPMPCGYPLAPRLHFRAGAGYLLSWDLVLWIETSPFARNNTVGTEDMLVGEWFTQGGVAKNQPTDGDSFFHDHPKHGGPCAQNITSESILVHKLKSEEQYLEVIAFFAKYDNRS